MVAMSKVGICNLAISLTGSKSSIQSLTEASAEAGYCNQWYDTARKEALESFDWGFARRRITLASHADDPPDNWGYRYQHPSDCIAMREIVNPGGDEADAIPFLVEADSTLQSLCILTDVDDAEAKYTFDQQTVGIFPSEFNMALAYFLASKMCLQLTGKRVLVEHLIAMASAQGAKAAANRANEEKEDKPRDTDWIRARS